MENLRVRNGSVEGCLRYHQRFGYATKAFQYLLVIMILAYVERCAIQTFSNSDSAIARKRRLAVHIQLSSNRFRDWKMWRRQSSFRLRIVDGAWLVVTMSPSEVNRGWPEFVRHSDDLKRAAESGFARWVGFRVWLANVGELEPVDFSVRCW